MTVGHGDYATVVATDKRCSDKCSGSEVAGYGGIGEADAVESGIVHVAEKSDTRRVRTVDYQCRDCRAMIVSPEWQSTARTNRLPAVTSVNLTRCLIHVYLSGLAEVGVGGDEGILLLAVNGLRKLDEIAVRSYLVWLLLGAFAGKSDLLVV